MNQNINQSTHKLFAQPCDFVLAAAAVDQFPSTAMPEVAFIGRSNVGKSSLINALVGRKGLARASNTPGRTQQIIFFNLAERLMLVDLPGYGHAEAPLAIKEQWQQLIQVYLRQRRNLKVVCLLLDGRHGVKANDLDMMNFLDRAAVVYQTVLTKIDQVRPADRDQMVTQVQQALARHPAALAAVLATSSEKKLGLVDLQEFIVQQLAINL